MSAGNSHRPAFPRDGGSGPLQTQVTGLTKREHFASLALAGMLAAEREEDAWTSDGAAKRAIRVADDLLAELERKERPDE